MNANQLKDACLKLLGSTETFPFGENVSVFKVADKMFALTDLTDDVLQISLKCDPVLASQLRATYPSITAGYHLNKTHWNTVTLDGTIPEPMLLDMLRDSYDLVIAGLPKRLRTMYTQQD